MANTVSVTTGSDVVTGDLTQFVTAPGDTIIVNGLSAKIRRQEHSALLLLDKPWPGPSATGATHWDILKTSSYWHSTQSLAQRVIALIDRIEAGMPFKPDAFGTTSGRAQYNDAQVAQV